MNHKQLLADFYLKLLSIPKENKFRIYNQSLYSKVRDTLAEQLGEDPEFIQNIFEKMADEDAKF